MGPLKLGTLGVSILTIGLVPYGASGHSNAWAAMVHRQGARRSQAASYRSQALISAPHGGWSVLPLHAGGPAVIALTLYTQNWALVRDTRQISLEPGRQRVRFAGVAAHLDNAPPILDIPATVLASRFAYDLGDRDRQLARYSGKTVRIFLPHSTRAVPAKLLDLTAGPLYQVGKELYSIPPDRVVLPVLPGTSARPALEWKVQARQAWTGQATASYAATGVGWTCSYTLRTDAGETLGNWTQWADIANHSGASYRAARTVLIAGQVQRAGGPMVPSLAGAEGVAAARFSPSIPLSYAARYEYRLPGRLTLGRDSSQRIKLAQASKMGLVRTFRFENWVPLAEQSPRSTPQDAEIRLTLVRGLSGYVAGPLPGGIVTVYTPDRHGDMAIAGQAAIPDTPSRLPVHLPLGRAFGVTLLRKQTTFEMSASSYHLAFDLNLANHQAHVAPIVIIERLPGDWQVVTASSPYSRDGGELRFTPVLAPHSSITIAYEVAVKRERPAP